jgi:CRP-like cAMP-binding protein
MAAHADVLQEVELFQGLSQRHLRKLAGKFRERRFKPGTPIVREGTMSGVGFFVVSEGDATVSVGGRKVGKLGPGDHFGELALIGERERTATVTADTALTCLVIPVWDFRDFVKGDPDVAWKLLRHVVGTLLDERAHR